MRWVCNSAIAGYLSIRPASIAVILLAAIACVIASLAAATPLPSFPGAEGFGAASIGGRGGRVIKVTNLDGDGPGSLRAAAAAEGPRIIVFAVAGVIRGDVVIKHSRVTIAGQSAPAPGITLEGRLLVRPEPWVRLHDIVVRYLRIRPPPIRGHEGDAVQLPDTERVMLDHLSLAWANDETVDIIHASEVTLQWSTIEESDLEGHAKGRGHNFGIISAYEGSGNVSIHHNLFAHHARRVPSLTPYVPGKPGDFRNNVVYDVREGLTHDGHIPREAINFVANYYKRGPSAERAIPFGFHPQGRYYLYGNVVEGFGPFGDVRGASSGLPAWLAFDRKGFAMTEAAPVAAVVTHAAEDAYRLVLQRAGCYPRDRVTIRTLAEVATGTGAWGRQAPSAPSDDWYLAGVRREHAPADSDDDGLPDAWEDANGLDKHDSRDHGRTLRSGYTAIETYLNERADMLAQRAASDREDVIVLLGASYTRAWPIHELRGRRVVNRGIDGERSEDMLRRFERDVIGARPAIVVIWGFINDIHRAPGGDVDRALAQARWNIAEMVRLARANGIQPILVTEVTIRPPAGLWSSLASWWGAIRRKNSYQEIVNRHVVETNHWLRQFAEREGILLLDFQPLLAEVSEMRAARFATADGTHISPAGYAALTAGAEAKLASALTP